MGALLLDSINQPRDLKQLNEQQVKQLCTEIRQFLLENISKTGGHLASNLGVVELTVALHRVLDTPQDKIVFDVGHQCYTHKILTGRRGQFDKLRQLDGISGFPNPNESEHDAFIAGHGNTALSLAIGMAWAKKLHHEAGLVVAVIGDGAFTGGMVYEGMNNIEQLDNLLVILNDNKMSISKNVGALAKYLLSIRNKRGYLKTKRAVEKVLTNTPVVGKPIVKVLKTSKDTVKNTVYRKSNNTTIFEDLGFIYLGPVDGHNLEDLEEVLYTAKSYHKPVVVHVNTVKGKGYAPAEKNPGEFHGISKFDIMTGNPEVSSDDCYSTVFGRELLKLALKDQKICAVTAAMKYGTGLQYFSNQLKDRFFDVGIAEQHAVTFSAGLASMGKIPVFAVYSSFLQRAIDQLIHDVTIGKNHIVLGIDRAGIVGEDGETHQGLYDIPLLTAIPNAEIYSPACYEELKMCLNEAIYKCQGLACVRYPKGNDCTSFNKSDLNTSYTFTENHCSDLLLVSYGRIYDELYKAYVLLNNENVKCDILKLTKIFPLENYIIQKSLKYKKIIFFEESSVSGGISQIFGNELLLKNFSGNYYSKGVKGFVKQATIKSILERIGLDCDSMVVYIKNILENDINET